VPITTLLATAQAGATEQPNTSTTNTNRPLLARIAIEPTGPADPRAQLLERTPDVIGYAQTMSENPRIERGWIYLNGTRQDDGTIKLGTGGEMRFSPFEAMSQRQETQITWGNILTASVQRLAFWRR
jgi:hypothetical protein